MKTIKCSTCKEELPFNSNYFYNNSTCIGGLEKQCKRCRYEKIKKRLKIKERSDDLTPETEENIKKMLEREEKRKQDLKEKIDGEIIGEYKLGKEYRITNSYRGKKDDNRFLGKVIYNDKRLLTLENNRGRRETFLKVDFVIGDYKIQNA